MGSRRPCERCENHLGSFRVRERLSRRRMCCAILLSVYTAVHIQSVSSCESHQRKENRETMVTVSLFRHSGLSLTVSATEGGFSLPVSAMRLVLVSIDNHSRGARTCAHNPWVDTGKRQQASANVGRELIRFATRIGESLPQDHRAATLCTLCSVATLRCVWSCS